MVRKNFLVLTFLPLSRHLKYTLVYFFAKQACQSWMVSKSLKANILIECTLLHYLFLFLCSCPYVGNVIINSKTKCAKGIPGEILYSIC